MIATAFLGTTLQARIDSTQDLSKNSYLKAIADRIVTGAGDPADWGSRGVVPSDLGLAVNPQLSPYELDIDKVSRLSNLSYPQLVDTARLNDIAVGITVSQTMALNLNQTNSYTVGADTYNVLSVATSVESKPTAASLQGYVIADSYQYNLTALTSDSGSYSLTVHFPTANAADALLVLFARAPFDERITSYATYNLGTCSQETAPTKTALELSPLNYALSFNQSYGSIQTVYVLSYSYQQTLTPVQSSPCLFPKLISNSPYVLVACGLSGAQPIEEWRSYPNVPLTVGSSFTNSERNLFVYTVTINGVLYRLDLTLGDINP